MSLQALAARLERIAPFHVMELAKMAAELEKQGRHIIHMGIGEPDFGAAPPVMEAALAAMGSQRLAYTSAVGLPALREAIAAHYAREFGLNIDPARIVVTAGASGALLLACAALVEQGAEVLMPDPSYPCNRHFVAAFDGYARLVPTTPDSRYQLTDAQVREHWGSATRGVLLASPSNPTGTSVPVETLKHILATVAERGGFAIVDEIYQGLSYEGQPTTALALSDEVVVINSFSKYFNMTGWRLGWLVLPPRLVSTFEKLAQNLFICPSTVAQYAGLACFSEPALAIYRERRDEFARRRAFIVPALQELGFKVPVVPDGAFYVYADCTPHTQDADAFTRELLNEIGIVLVPGMDFGPTTARTHIRLSYATALDNLKEAVQRMQAYLPHRARV